jgi:hypothetical protein
LDPALDEQLAHTHCPPGADCSIGTVAAALDRDLDLLTGADRRDRPERPERLRGCAVGGH